MECGASPRTFRSSPGRAVGKEALPALEILNQSPLFLNLHRKRGPMATEILLEKQNVVFTVLGITELRSLRKLKTRQYNFWVLLISKQITRDRVALSSGYLKTTELQV